MGSFGDRLRREREMRGVTLEEISHSTKIGTRNLKALETEEFGILPGGIFNRGFVRSYARFLGLDEEQCVADYNAAVERQTSPPPVSVPETQHTSTPAITPPVVGYVLLVLLCLGGWYGYKKYGRSHSAPEPAPVQAASPESPAPVASPASSSVTSAPAPSVSTDQTHDTSTAPAIAPNDTSSDAPADKDAPPKPQPVVSNQKASDTRKPAADADDSEKQDPPPISVGIHLHEESWVSVSADGKEMLSSILEPDTDRSFTAQKTMTLKLGNAPAVDISYNGKPYAVPVISQGKVATLNFTAQGPQP